MGRTPCCDKDGLKKGPWTPEEDQKLVDYIKKHGYGNWRTLPKNAGLQRCGKSCRLRWTNYLRPDIKRGKFSFEEEEMIIQLHSILGNKWSAIAARLPGRTDNEIKNYWNTRIRKRLLRMGIDPVTHSPRLDLLDLSSVLNNPLYSQMNHLSSLFGTQTLVNPEILRLATSVVSPQLENSNYLPRDFQQEQYNQQLMEDLQLQAQFQEVPTRSSPMMEHNAEGYRDPFGFYYVPEQNINETLNPAPEKSLGSAFSAATSSSSTPGNSNSQCINAVGGVEDERESYCSSLLNYATIPDFLDMNSCNEIHQLIGDSEFLGPWNCQPC